MLSLSLGLGLSSSQGTATPPPSLSSNNGTTQGAVLTVTNGTLYRDGVAKTSPYTTTAVDALSVFWAADASDTPSSRSTPITIASTAGATPTVQGMRVTIANANNGGTGDTVFSEFQVKDSGGAVMPYTVTATLAGGTTAAFNDGLKTSPYAQSTALPWSFDIAFTSPTADWFGGSFAFSAYESNYNFAPGDFSVKYDAGSGFGATYASYDAGAGWSYSYGTLTPFHTIPGYGALSISSLTYDSDANTMTHVITGSTGTVKMRVRDFSVSSYPILITDWTNTTASATTAATTGGILRYDYYDTDAAGAAVQSGERVVAGTRPSKVGLNVGTTYGKPHYAQKFSFYRDWVDQCFYDVVGGTYNGQVLTPGGAFVDKYNRLVAWPTGATEVHLTMGWYAYTSDVGEREWLSGGVYTKDNYGVAWDYHGSGGGSGITVNSVTAGANGGVKITYANESFPDTWITLYSLPSAMTAHSMYLTAETHPEKILTDDCIASFDLGSGALRWMWWGLEGFGQTTAPHPSDPTWATYMASWPTWANRKQKGFRPEVMVEASNRSSRDLLLNLPLHTSSDYQDYLTNLGAYLQANLDSNLNVHVAGINESTWNTGAPFYNGFSNQLYFGYAAGYSGTSPTRTPVTVVRNTANGATVAAGYAQDTYLFSYLDGAGGVYSSFIFKAKRLTLGTSLPTTGVGTGNSDWDVVAGADTTAGDNGYAAVQRYYGVKLYNDCALLKASLGSRLIPAPEDFVFSNLTGSASTDPMVMKLTFPQVSGGPALMDLQAGVFRWLVAPYPGSIGLDTGTSPGNAASGATRQAAILSALQTQFALDIGNSGGCFPKTYLHRTTLASLVATARTVNGVSTRYSPGLSEVGGYEFNSGISVPSAQVVAVGDDVALCADMYAVQRASSYETDYTSLLTACWKHGGDFALLSQGTTPVTKYGNDFDVLESIPPNFVSPVRGREKALIDFAVGK